MKIFQDENSLLHPLQLSSLKIGIVMVMVMVVMLMRILCNQALARFTIRPKIATAIASLN